MDIETAHKARVRDGMQGVYQRQAAAWDATRGKGLSERAWLDKLLALTRPGDHVLDLGCGSGDPIAAYIVAAGRRICGVDFAPAMLELASQRMPDETWILGDMRSLALGKRYAAIIGWDSFFHLSPVEQRAVLPRLRDHLEPGGGLLLTVGPRAGEPLGEVGGEPVYHASLDPDEYRSGLAGAGLELIEFVPDDPECGRTVLLARRVLG